MNAAAILPAPAVAVAGGGPGSWRAWGWFRRWLHARPVGICRLCRHPHEYHGEMVGDECFSCHRHAFWIEAELNDAIAVVTP